MQKLIVSCYRRKYFLLRNQFVSWKRWDTLSTKTKKKQNNKQRKQGEIYIKRKEWKGRGEMIDSRKVEGKGKSFEENL